MEKESVLAQFTSVVSKQKSAYPDFVSMGESEEIERFYSLVNLPSTLGGSTFKDFIKEKFMCLANTVEIPESKALASDVNGVISGACGHCSVPPRELMYSKRGTENAARGNSIYLVRRFAA